MEGTTRHTNIACKYNQLWSHFKTNFSLFITAQSPVLNRMICEAAENHIKVENVAQKAFEVFLGYLYMNPLPELNKQQTLELLSIAHTYEVWVLQETCSDLLEGWLKKNRDFDFVVEVFEIADELLCKKELIAKAYNIVKR